jgi:hypothetical protein
MSVNKPPYQSLRMCTVLNMTLAPGCVPKLVLKKCSHYNRVHHSTSSANRQTSCHLITWSSKCAKSGEGARCTRDIKRRRDLFNRPSLSIPETDTAVLYESKAFMGNSLANDEGFIQRTYLAHGSVNKNGFYRCGERVWPLTAVHKSD